jgi:hypothetical protein
MILEAVSVIVKCKGCESTSREMLVEFVRVL